MKKIYVTHPYSGKKSNQKSVEEIIKKLVKQNPNSLYLSPIHTLGFLYFELNYDEGMKQCFELLKTCDALYLCPGWENSKGCKLEKEFAENNNIPIFKVTKFKNYILR